MRLYARHILRSMQQNKAAYLGAVCIIALGKGIVQTEHTQTIVAAVSGTLTKLTIEENSVVHAGDVNCLP